MILEITLSTSLGLLLLETTVVLEITPFPLRSPSQFLQSGPKRNETRADPMGLRKALINLLSTKDEKSLRDEEAKGRKRVDYYASPIFEKCNQWIQEIHPWDWDPNVKIQTYRSFMIWLVRTAEETQREDPNRRIRLWGEKVPPAKGSKERKMRFLKSDIFKGLFQYIDDAKKPWALEHGYISDFELMCQKLKNDGEIILRVDHLGS